MIIKLSWRRFATFLIVVIPIFDIYSFPFLFNGLSTALQFLLIFVLLLCPTKKNEDVVANYQTYSIKKRYCFWVCVTILCLLIAMIINIELGFNYRKLLSLFIILAILCLIRLNKIDTQFLLKLYIFFSVVSCVYLFLQVLFAYLLHIVLPQNILPFETIGGVYDAGMEMGITGVFRASSFFSEPAAFSQYLIPAICILLLKANSTKKDLMMAIIFTVAIFLSTSSLGIILAAIVWMISFYFRSKKNVFKWGTMILILFAIVGYILLSNSFLFKSFTNIFGVIGQANSKTSERVYKGFAVFSKLPIVNKFFGIGLGNAKHFILNYNIRTVFDSQWYESFDYYNGVSSALIYGGVFGCISFLLAPITFIKKGQRISAIIAFVFILMSFGSSTFFTTMFLFYGILMLSFASFNDNGIYKEV